MTVDELLKKLDDATSAASTRLDALVASIKASGQTLTTAQQTEADAISSHLDALAATAADPVPAAPPVTPGL